MNDTRSTPIQSSLSEHAIVYGFAAAAAITAIIVTSAIVEPMLWQSLGLLAAWITIQVILAGSASMLEVKSKSEVITLDTLLQALPAMHRDFLFLFYAAYVITAVWLIYLFTTAAGLLIFELL